MSQKGWPGFEVIPPSSSSTIECGGSYEKKMLCLHGKATKKFREVVFLSLTEIRAGK